MWSISGNFDPNPPGVANTSHVIIIYHGKDRIPLCSHSSSNRSHAFCTVPHLHRHKWRFIYSLDTRIRIWRFSYKNEANINFKFFLIKNLHQPTNLRCIVKWVNERSVADFFANSYNLEMMHGCVYAHK